LYIFKTDWGDICYAQYFLDWIIVLKNGIKKGWRYQRGN